MQYKPVSKSHLLATMAADSSAPSLWDVSKWGDYWNTGAKDLEKSAPGKLITAPVRILNAATDSTKNILDSAPKIVNRASWTLPIIGIAAAIVGSGYLVWKFKLGNKNKKDVL